MEQKVTYLHMLEKIREMAKSTNERFIFRNADGEWGGVRIDNRIFTGNLWKTLLDLDSYLEDEGTLGFLTEMYAVYYNEQESVMKLLEDMKEDLYEDDGCDGIWVTPIK